MPKKLVRDYEAERQVQEDYRRDLDMFVAGKRDKPPHPAWTPSVIYKEVEDKKDESAETK